MNTIKIKDKEYKVKPTLRAIFIFEQITDKSFKLETMLDNYLYFYSLLLANNEDVMEWEEFLEILDEDPTIYLQLNEILLKNSKINELLNDIEEESPDKKGLKKN